jgi:hypothetical protein
VSSEKVSQHLNILQQDRSILHTWSTTVTTACSALDSAYHTRLIADFWLIKTPRPRRNKSHTV